MIVSVVIPVYNRPDELRRALKSVLSQTIQDFEVFVVDDCSEVDLQSVVDSFQDDRLHFHRMEQKGNANVSRNFGILNAKGEFVALLDSDDEWEVTHLERSIEFIENAKADGVYASMYIFDGETKRFVGAKEVAKEQGPANYLMTGGVAQTSSYLLRRACAQEVLFDETLRRHQDYDFFIRFYDKFKWVVKWQPTSIVHWSKGEKRNRDIDSELRFMYVYQSRFSKRVWIEYFMKQYSYFLNADANVINRKRYRDELLRHMPFLTYADFCQIHENRRGVIGSILNWADYNRRLLFKKKGV